MGTGYEGMEGNEEAERLAEQTSMSNAIRPEPHLSVTGVFWPGKWINGLPIKEVNAG